MSTFISYLVIQILNIPVYESKSEFYPSTAFVLFVFYFLLLGDQGSNYQLSADASSLQYQPYAMVWHIFQVKKFSKHKWSED